VKLLFISNLFPNPREPQKGIFNAQQVHALSNRCDVTVIAPTSQVLATEDAYGARVLHPKVFHLPVLTRPWNGWLYARGIEQSVRTETFDIALASFAYPDGYAVMLLAERLHFPFAIDVLGSDINLLFHSPRHRKRILRALYAGRAVFAKSRALADQLATHGIYAHLDYNGIDHATFRLRDRRTACEHLKLAENRRRILYVGNLHAVKGPRVLATAFESLRDIADLDLVFIGSGPEAAHIAFDGRVRGIGPVPHHDVAVWMSACDLFCLPSQQEGLPNVILEAMACGRPVVASQVGGVPEIVQPDITGLLVPPGDGHALAKALRRALTLAWDAAAISRATELFDWDRNARTLLTHLERALEPRNN
jgi:glycosyltransferase involved in cell wall biosynthesis